MMDAQEIHERVAVAARRVGDFRAQLRRSPGLALLTAVAAGFLAGLLLRCFERKPGVQVDEE